MIYNLLKSKENRLILKEEQYENFIEDIKIRKQMFFKYENRYFASAISSLGSCEFCVFYKEERHPSCIFSTITLSKYYKNIETILSEEEIKYMCCLYFKEIPEYQVLFLQQE